MFVWAIFLVTRVGAFEANRFDNWFHHWFVAFSDSSIRKFSLKKPAARNFFSNVSLSPYSRYSTQLHMQILHLHQYNLGRVLFSDEYVSAWKHEKIAFLYELYSLHLIAKISTVFLCNVIMRCDVTPMTYVEKIWIIVLNIPWEGSEVGETLETRTVRVMQSAFYILLSFEPKYFILLLHIPFNSIPSLLVEIIYLNATNKISVTCRTILIGV